MFIAQRNLFGDKGRLALSVAGIALAVMLILILGGFLSGVYQQATAYLDNTPGTVVVTQSGVSGFFASTSLLPAGTEQAVRQTEGVARVVPITAQTILFELHGSKTGAEVVGYDPALGGGPWQISTGRGVQAADEIVVDLALARTHSIAVGDTFILLNHQFKVVGLAGGASMWAAGYLFVSKDTLASLLNTPAATSLLLVTPSPGVSPQMLRDRLANLRGVDVVRKSDVAANDTQFLTSIYSGPLWLMLGIAFLVGTLVVGLIVYTSTVERQREYGTLKALGAGNGLLYRVVASQALLTAVVGAIIGVAIAYGAAQLIVALRPQLLVSIEPATVGWALLTGLVMALLGALFPARTIARLAPADVFRRLSVCYSLPNVIYSRARAACLFRLVVWAWP